MQWRGKVVTDTENYLDIKFVAGSSRGLILLDAIES